MENEIKRKQFTFYRSFYEALSTLPDNERLSIYDAIASFALDGEEPYLSGIASTVFILIRPTLQSGRNKASSGQDGGEAGKGKAKQKQTKSRVKANEKQNESYGEEATDNQNESKKEIEVEVKKENKIDIDIHDGDFTQVYDLFVSRVNPTASNDVIIELKSYYDQLDAECCIRAINIAIERGATATNWRYIRKILKNLIDAGLHSIEDWEMYENGRKNGVKSDMAENTGEVKDPQYHPDWFNEFWDAYPRHTDKMNAVRIWDEIRPARELVDKMLKAICKFKKSKQWKDQTLIPHPSNWLRYARWDDEVPLDEESVKRDSVKERRERIQKSYEGGTY